MEKTQRVCAALLVGLVVACLLVSSDCAAVHNRRAVAETSPSVNLSMVKTCHTSTPCGWAVYMPFTRRVDYFMKNTCECAAGNSCMRSEDDLSVSAYVYRCHPDTPNQDGAEPQVS